MQALEAAWSKATGLPLWVLMEHAGRKAAEVIVQGHGKKKSPLVCVVLAGPGNNGGDGLATARWLHHWGISVSVYLCATRDQLSENARQQLQASEALGVSITDFTQQSPAWMAAQLRQLKPEDVVVDALFGTGLKRPIAAPWDAIIHAANQCNAYRIAVDVPSGLDANLGRPVEEDSLASVVMQAHRTIAVGYAKVGICSAPGFTYAGSIEIADIGLPSAWIPEAERTFVLLDAQALQFLATPGSVLAHKGTHGHLMVLAGSAGKVGAGWLATQGALHVGVGRCTWMLPETLHPIMQGEIPEAMTAGYASAKDISDLLDGKQALVVGPGLSPKSDSILEACLRHTNPMPLVLDADALSLLAEGKITSLREVTSQRPVVLTPHPGEAARLLRTSPEDIQKNRIEAACTLAEQTGAIVVLKGPRTLVVEKNPSTHRLRCAINPTGNAQMGTGGMGDLLAGMIGALLLRGSTPYEAACAAVYWHGATADWLATNHPPGLLLRAGQVCQALPETLHQLLQTGSYPTA